ncbi:MAG: hypothetical protein ACJZ9F_03765 [Rhodospirillaceae bacterium]
MKNVATLLVTLLLCFVGAEWVFRFSGFAPRTLDANKFFVDGAETTWSIPDDEIGWINRAGKSIAIEEGAAPMTFWSNGRRASRESPSIPEGGVPVIVVGGSNAQSYGVRDEESFPYLVASTHPDLWIENFGTGGFGTIQTLMLTERILANMYRRVPPALIIATFADSHVLRNVSDQSWVYAISDSEGRYVSPPHYRVKDGDFSFSPFKTIRLWPLESQSALVTMFHKVWLQSFVYDTADQGLPITRYAFRQLASLANSHGSKLLVVILEDYRRIATDVFQDASFPVLDCSGYEKTMPEKYLLGGGGHPNAAYHNHFAHCLGQWIDGNLGSLVSAIKP